MDQPNRKWIDNFSFLSKADYFFNLCSFLARMKHVVLENLGYKLCWLYQCRQKANVRKITWLTVVIYILKHKLWLEVGGTEQVIFHPRWLLEFQGPEYHWNLRITCMWQKYGSLVICNEAQQHELVAWQVPPVGVPAMVGTKCLKCIYKLCSDAFTKLALGMYVIIDLPSLFFQATGLLAQPLTQPLEFDV